MVKISTHISLRSTPRLFSLNHSSPSDRTFSDRNRQQDCTLVPSGPVEGRGGHLAGSDLAVALERLSVLLSTATHVEAYLITPNIDHKGAQSQ